ncbi:MAG: excinuclease ABC subunit UvrC [Acidobacteriota bacterium]
MLSPRLIARLDSLPDAPGVYLFKGAAGRIIYVGKALSLRNRVRQYFQSHRPDEKVSFLVEEIEDLELVVVDSEKEALLLESSLIRRYHPRYNTNLKDDKQYPLLRLTDEPFPRLTLVRKVQKDGARYFGPYIPASLARVTLNTAQKFFKIRWCAEKMGSRKRPCLDYYIHRCLGPCANLTSREQYAEAVGHCVLLLEGKHQELLGSLRSRMEKAAEEERFEEAAGLRDMIRGVEALKDRQKIILPLLVDQDIFGCHREGGEALVMVFNRRRGVVVDRREFLTAAPSEVADDELLSDLILQYYEQAQVPQQVLVPTPVPKSLGEILAEKAGRKVRVHCPSRGEAARLVKLLARNARQRFETRRTLEPLLPDFLADVQRILSLPSQPRRIEGFDISHLGGTGTVASLVVFENGYPLKRDYRRYHIRTVTGADDFKSMKEVVFRRYRRVIEEDLPRPDLILIDGGKGQLGAALEALRDVGLAGPAVVALAKREEEIYVPTATEPLHLPRDSAPLKLMQRVRDEAHRFAVTFQRKTREAPLRRRRGRTGKLTDEMS